MSNVTNSRPASLVVASVCLAVLSACSTTPCKPMPKIPSHLLARPQEPILLNSQKSASKTDAAGKPAGSN